MRVRYKNDGLGPMLDQDVLRTSMVAMDGKTPMLDAFDTGFRRPGFRSSTVRDAARQKIADAYAAYENDLVNAYKNAPTRTADANDSGFLPVRPLRQIEHGEQVDRPRPPRKLREREDRDDDDEDDRERTSDGKLVCDGCSGAGYCPGCDSSPCPVCHGSGIDP
jgi:hypothetical protein